MTLSKLLTVASVLLTGFSVSAGRFSDLHNHYYGKPKAAPVQAAVTEPMPESQMRYLNAKTKKYRVTSLPDVPFDVGEMYSGNMPIDKTDKSRQLFFIYQPSVGEPVDEVTIWLNGGPGCSSLLGFFQENGRFTWQPGTYQPVVNQYSWVNLTNMLWVEQPVGTGFAFGKVTAKTQEETAQDFIGFFKNFQKTFGIKNYKIYVTGESYAGRYVPYISAAMLDEKDTEYYNLQGALVYDPCIGQFDYTQSQVVAYPLVEANNNLFNFNPNLMKFLKKEHEKCGYQGVLDKYYKFPPPSHQPPEFFNYTTEGNCDVFDIVFGQALKNNPCFNIYNIAQNCPLLDDVLSFPTALSVVSQPTYFDRDDVKTALHAPHSITWTPCANGPVFVGGNPPSQPGGRYDGGPQGEGDLSSDPIQKVLPQVIEATNRVLVSNGDYDMIIISKGTLLAIQNMTWNGMLGFQREPSSPFRVRLPDLQYADIFTENGLGQFNPLPQGIMGTNHFERGLMWVQTSQAGHMQPQFQPRAAYRHLQWLLRRINHL